MTKDLELLNEPKFKKTPKERKQEKKFGSEQGDFIIPMVGVLGGGVSVSGGASYGTAKKLEKKYKEEAEKKKKEEEKKSKKETKNKEEKEVEVKREEKFMGGLVRSGKPKLAKKGCK